MANTPEQLELLRRLELRSMISVPLFGRGRVLGALTLCFGKSGRRHSEADLQLAEELAGRAGVAVTQAGLFAEAQAAAAAAAAAAHAAETASRVKDEFLATVSHELRTPLNAIVGWASLLRERNKDPAQTKGLDVIFRNAQAQSKIIDDILDVSRIITGKLRLDFKLTDLSNIARDAIEVVRPSANAKGIEIELRAPDVPCQIAGDPERVQQVIWNLLSNAIKFTDEGGSIQVALEPEVAQVRLCVTDTGRGIEHDFLPYVFDRFKQADGSTTRRVGGLGLGLSIVRHIVELHGGSVAVSSDGPGRGASFSVNLPVRAIAASAQDAVRRTDSSPKAAPEPERVLRDLKLLVVDDEPDALELMSALLQRAGAVVETAGSAREAMNCLMHFQPDVIVSDIGMPEEDGYALIRRVRSEGPLHARSVPALALTAYARAEDKRQAMDAGFTAHLSKPASPDALISTVAKLAAR